MYNLLSERKLIILLKTIDKHTSERNRAIVYLEVYAGFHTYVVCQRLDLLLSSTLEKPNWWHTSCPTRSLLYCHISHVITSSIHGDFQLFPCQEDFPFCKYIILCGPVVVFFLKEILQQVHVVQLYVGIMLWFSWPLICLSYIIANNSWP